MRRLYLADLHLETPDDRRFATFARLLDTVAGDVDCIHLLGDLVDVWIGDDDDGPLACALRELLARTSRRCEVTLLRGNRDFLFGERFAADTGVRLLPDPWQQDGGTLLCHGDALCVDDTDYQQLRRRLRSPAWQRAFLARQRDDRQAAARSLRRQSRAAGAQKPAAIMDVNADAVATLMAAHGCRRLIHGHTHRPGRHRHPWGERFVLGEWSSCAWLLDGHDDDYRLRCLPLEGPRR